MNTRILNYDDYPDSKRVFVVEKQSDWLTTSEAAAIMEVRMQHVQYLCRTGEIECKKHGRDWIVSRASAEGWKRKKSGRPKKE